MHEIFLTAVARDITDARVRRAEQVRTARRTARKQPVAESRARRRLARRIGIGIPLVLWH
jgi:hypothetical protein